MFRIGENQKYKSDFSFDSCRAAFLSLVARRFYPTCAAGERKTMSAIRTPRGPGHERAVLSREPEVRNDTTSLCLFFDDTAQAECFYWYVDECVRGHCEAERSVATMPDLRASLITRLIMQNDGKLSENKGKQFPELTEEEIERMERSVAALLSVQTQ